MDKGVTIKLTLLKVIAIVIAVFAVAVMCVTGFFVVYCRTYVNGLSMYPTLNSSLEYENSRDIIYINRFAKVVTMDVVVLDLTKDINFKTYVVKRLVANEGDIVNITYSTGERRYNLTVNGEIIYSKPYKDLGYISYDNFISYINNHEADTSRVAKDEHGNILGVRLKTNEIYVMGDNWDISKDSTQFGPFDKKSIVGRVDIVVKHQQNEFIQVLKSIF
ncbi:MAG: signal peptidase I [Clostridia bacterium]|nr:signal peptidase I [Clostridia bacterium]